MHKRIQTEISLILVSLLGLAVLIGCATATPPAPPTVVPTAVPTLTAPTAAPTTAPTVVPPTVALTSVPPTAVPPTLAPTQVPPAATVAPTTMPVTVTPAPVVGAPTITLTNQINGGFVADFGWSADNQTLTAQVEGNIAHYNAPSLKLASVISSTFAAQVFALSPDGSQVVGLAKDQSVQIWDATTGKSIVTLQKAGMPIGATWTPDGSMVATFSSDKIEIQLWDAKTGKPGKLLSGFQTAAPVYGAVFAADNKTMAWVSRATVQFMDIASGTLGTKLQFEDFVGGAQFTPDSKSFVTTDDGTVNNATVGLVQVWNVSDGKMTQQLSDPQLFTGLSISPVGTYLATAIGNNVETWDWSKGGAAMSATSTGQIATLQFSNDGKELATGDQNGVIAIWNVE